MTTPRTIPVDLEKLIHALDSKMPRKLIGMERKPYLQNWNISIAYYMAPIYKKANHARKMKLAWMAKGNTGLLEYLEPHVRNKAKFEVIRKVILAIK
jgi:hypothetical protein